MQNENHANPTPIEYFNHLVNNGFVVEEEVNDVVGCLVTILITPKNQHKLLMPQESHLKALQQYKLEEDRETRLDMYSVKPNSFIELRLHKLKFSPLPFDARQFVPEYKIKYFAGFSVSTTEQYRRDILPYVSFG
ncbi:hypothetical protein ACFX5K_00605 [Rickettsiales bacterium LUAb2]